MKVKANILKEEIDKVLESTIEELPKFRELRDGQKEVVKKRMLQYMIEDISADFLKISDVKDKLDILKFLSDYAGYKPSVKVDASIYKENPYEGLTDQELDEAQRELMHGYRYDEIGADSEVTEDKDSES
jgi:phenylalanine-4-hydroxylase